MIDEIILLRPTKTIAEISQELNITVSKIRTLIKRGSIPPKQRGRPFTDFMDQKVTIPFCVKRKHYNAAQKEINEIIKKYR